MGSIVPDARVAGEGTGWAGLAGLGSFRCELYGCLTARADALFELTDAVLCAEGPVRSLVELALAAEHRRGHGALYDGLNCGGMDVARLRAVVAGLAVPRGVDGRITLAVDVSPWLRPDAAGSPERMFCHVYGRGKGQAQMVPGWPYSFVVALETGRTSWTAVLDAVRLGPADDQTTVTAGQVRDVVGRLRAAGHWADGDPDVLVVFDAGYDVTRLAFLLGDLPVEVLGRMRSDRVLQFPAPARTPAARGRPPRHGAEFHFADPTTWPAARVTTTTATTRYGRATAAGWDRLHPRLTHRGGWETHDGPLPVLTGTVIRLSVERLPGDRHPKPVWLWSSRAGAAAADVDRLWQAFLRRFDIEHTFRLFKQTLGWTAPKTRTPQAADRWTWIIIAAHTQLRLARHLTDDLRRPWERPPPPGRLTPPGSGEGFGTSAARPPSRPAHRNPPTPAPDAHPDPATPTQPATTTSEKPPKPTRQATPEVKRQAEPNRQSSGRGALTDPTASQPARTTSPPLSAGEQQTRPPPPPTTTPAARSRLPAAPGGRHRSPKP